MRLSVQKSGREKWKYILLYSFYSKIKFLYKILYNLKIECNKLKMNTMSHYNKKIELVYNNKEIKYNNKKYVTSVNECKSKPKKKKKGRGETDGTNRRQTK